MKKFILTLLCLAVTTSWVHANIFSIGPRVGGSIAQIKVNPPQGDQAYKRLQLKGNWGYHVGVVTRLDFFSFFIQPEALFTGSGAKFSQNNQEMQLSFTKLDVPVMVGLSLFGVVRAQLGPVFSVLLRATKGKKSVKAYYQDVTVGYQAGLGMDIWNLMLDVKYEGHLTKSGKQLAGILTDQWILSVGFNVL